MKKQYLVPEIDIIRFDNNGDILTLSVDGGGSAVGGEGSIGGWNLSSSITDHSDQTEVKSIFD